MKINRKWLSILVLASVMALAACTGGESKEDNAPKEGKAEIGGDLVLAVQSDASTLDPAGSDDIPSHNVQQAIFEGLIKRDDENNLIPGLAKEWTVVDELTYEFTLEEEVTFHDGETFNAEAVKINLERLIDPEVASSKYNKFEMIADIEVLDEFKLRVTTEYPFSPILAHLSHSGAAIISPKAIEADYEAIKNGKNPGTAISENPIGTGHFKFVSWTSGDEVQLVKNDTYWGEQALVDTVTFKVVPESGTRNADLERGFVQIANPVQPIDVDLLNGSDYAEVIQTSSTGLAFAGFNMNKAPFNDVNVRKAVSMMVDKQAIIDGVYDGFGTVGEGPLAPNVFGYSEDIKGIEYNVEEAKALMKEAGHEEGFKATVWTNDSPQRSDTAVYLQSVLKEINIELAIEQMEFGAFIENLKSGDHDMYILGWTNPLAEADNGLFSLFHSSTAGVPPNAMWYGSTIVDELLDKGRQETDIEERLKLYKQAQEEIVNDAPMIFLSYPEYLTGVSKKVTGFKIDSGGIYHLDQVQFVE